MLQPIVELASDLAANLAPDELMRRVLATAGRIVPCDAAALLRLDDGALVPIAADGLRAEAIGRRYLPAEHPRLARVLDARAPIGFDGTELPDPFDGLFAHAGDTLARAHACLGCPLIVEGRVIGVLALDAVNPGAFERVAADDVTTLAALASAAIRTTSLATALERAGRTDRTDRAGPRPLAGPDGGGRELLGTSPAMQRVRRDIELLAGSELSVLITGETGVGKELVAHAIHASSPRAARPLVRVNCAALPEALAESELFGHVRGAFTGAIDHRAGKFEIADGGTLFLDEIGELPLAIQPKLLRVLQAGEVQRVGADCLVRVDVRVIAATNRDLWHEAATGRFRADLLYRLGVFPLAVPALRERLEDIPVLSGRLLQVARRRLGLPPLRLSPAARRWLRDHAWPGNVRELEHALTRGALRASEHQRGPAIVIDAEHLALEPPASAPRLPAGADSPRLRDAVDGFTRELIERTVAASAGNWAEAARRLGLQRGNLHRLAGRLGMRAIVTCSVRARRSRFDDAGRRDAPRARAGAGTSLAAPRRMAAVLCLVFLPLVAALGFMLGVVGGDASGGSLLGGLAFLLIGAGMFLGIFNMSKTWDEEPPR